MKEIQFDQDARGRLLSGIQQLHRAVSSTLGARGKHVIFNQGDQIAVTKDGVTVANQFKLDDPIEDAGAKLVREAAARTARDAGDGTTTSTVIAYHLIEGAMKAISNGYSAIDIKKGIELARDHTLKSIDNMSKPVDNVDDIYNIARISGNNDTNIGRMISDVFDKVGRNGAVRLEETQMNETTVDVVHGCQIDRGYIHQNFITNQSKRTAELQNPVIFITDKVFNGSIEEIKPVLEAAMRVGRPLVIFCASMEGETLGTIMMNKVRGNIQALVVETPEFDRSVMQQIYEDMAIITGGVFVSEEKGVLIKDFKEYMFGSADMISSDSNTTTIIGRNGNADDIQKRVDEIKAEIDDDKTKSFTWRLNKRIATLTGGVGVIYVGGNSPSETKEMYYRLEDALASAKAALDEGILPGGGVAYMKAAKEASYMSVDGLRNGVVLGWNIFINAMSKPTSTIIHNSTDDGEEIVNKIYDSPDVNFGYDVSNDTFCDMIERGIIDPTKVAKTAIINATSVAGMIITTDCVIVDKPRQK